MQNKFECIKSKVAFASQERQIGNAASEKKSLFEKSRDAAGSLKNMDYCKPMEQVKFLSNDLKVVNREISRNALSFYQSNKVKEEMKIKKIIETQDTIENMQPGKKAFMDLFMKDFLPKSIEIKENQKFKSYAEFDYHFQMQNKKNFYIFDDSECIIDKNSGNYVSKEMKCVQEGCQASVCINYQKEGYYTVTKCQLTHSNHENSVETYRKYYENKLTEGENAMVLRLISKLGKDFEVISKEINRLTGKTVQVEEINRILDEENLRKKRSVIHLYELFKSKEIYKKQKSDN